MSESKGKIKTRPFTLKRRGESVICIVKDCKNDSLFDDGKANLNSAYPLCSDCVAMLTTGEVGEGKTFIHELNHWENRFREKYNAAHELLIDEIFGSQGY